MAAGSWGEIRSSGFIRTMGSHGSYTEGNDQSDFRFRSCPLAPSLREHQRSTGYRQETVLALLGLGEVRGPHLGLGGFGDAWRK